MTHRQLQSLPDEIAQPLVQLDRKVRLLAMLRGVALLVVLIIAGVGTGLLLDLWLGLGETVRVALLAALGVASEALPDGIRIRGGPVQGGVVESRGDHRVAMSFAVLAARASAPVIIRDVQNVATSFPAFAATARAAGLDLAEES